MSDFVVVMVILPDCPPVAEPHSYQREPISVHIISRSKFPALISYFSNAKVRWSSFGFCSMSFRTVLTTSACRLAKVSATRRLLVMGAHFGQIR
jgi:hypothetical protein